jgi:hypothetical protein
MTTNDQDLTLTGGINNWEDSGAAQLDLAGPGYIAGAVSQIIAPAGFYLRTGGGTYSGTRLLSSALSTPLFANTTGVGIFNQSPSVALDVTGAVNASSTITAPSFNATSSRKWKTNITPITNALDTVSKLQGVTFDWNNKDVKNDFGLIAEDVNEVLPTIVGKDTDNNISGVDYGRITALLIETVKELNAKVKILEDKLTNR